jgi:hypothetical protein
MIVNDRLQLLTTKPTDLVQGTLDLLILKTISVEPKHGWAIAKRIQRSNEIGLRVALGAPGRAPCSGLSSARDWPSRQSGWP